MRLVTRYILREHVGPLLFAVATLTSLLLLNYISKKFADLVGKGLPWDVIAKFFMLSVPFVFAMTLPMAVLISTLYAFSRMGSDSEVTALMSSGVSTRQLLTPVLVAGLLMSIGMVAFNDQVLPRANQKLSGLMSSIQQKKPTLALKAQTLNPISRRGPYMWISQLDSRRNAMQGVTIHDLSEGTSRRTIQADSGLLAFAPNQRDLILTLFDGYVEETRMSDPDRFQRTFFKTNILRVEDVANQLVLSEEDGYKGDREMTVCELLAVVRRSQRTRDSTIRALGVIDPARAKEYSGSAGSPTGELYCNALDALAPKVAQAQGTAQQQTPSPRIGRPGAKRVGAKANVPIQVEMMMQSIDAATDQIAEYDVEIQKKFAISLACLIFALLGPPIALRFPRSGVGLTIGVSLSVFALYYVGLIAGESLANNGKVTPVIAMWAANAILATIGIVLSLRMSHYAGGARGASFREVLQRMWPWRRAQGTG